MKYAINSPIGAFGNHLRWLLLLDEKFKFSLSVTPVSEAFTANPTKNQIDTSPTYEFKELQQKFNFIKTHVYNENRTWHNWLAIEWQYRIQLASLISFNHDYVHITPNTTVKTIATTISPTLAYKSYLKFNSHLNNTSKEKFQNVISNNNWHIKNLSNYHNLMIINSDNLFTPSLDSQLYKSMTDFFELTNLYDSANSIHQLWYNLHKKAEKEFVETVQQIYN